MNNAESESHRAGSRLAGFHCFCLERYCTAHRSFPVYMSTLTTRFLITQPVIMSIDVNQNGIFSAQKAAEHAAAGELTVKIALGTAMTNAQIDMLVEKLEKEVALSVVANPEDAGELPTRQSVKNFAEMSSILPAGIEETLAGTIGQDQSTFLNVERSTDLSGVDDDGAVRVYRPTGQGRNTKSRRKIIKRRHWDEVEDEEEAEDDAAGLISNKLYREVRGSLEEALTSLSEKEGLTDDELKQKVTSRHTYLNMATFVKSSTHYLIVPAENGPQRVHGESADESVSAHEVFSQLRRQVDINRSNGQWVGERGRGRCSAAQQPALVARVTTK